MFDFLDPKPESWTHAWTPVNTKQRGPVPAFQFCIDIHQYAGCKQCCSTEKKDNPGLFSLFLQSAVLSQRRQERQLFLFVFPPQRLRRDFFQLNSPSQLGRQQLLVQTKTENCFGAALSCWLRFTCPKPKKRKL